MRAGSWALVVAMTARACRAFTVVASGRVSHSARRAARVASTRGADATDGEVRLVVERPQNAGKAHNAGKKRMAGETIAVPKSASPLWSYDLESRADAGMPDFRQEWDLVIDARSPSEFADDALPGAINLPVLDDDERATVGTLYKQVSSFDARVVGARLVAARLAEILADERVASLGRDARVLVYCWRGGDRSGSLAHTLSRVGWHTAQLDGGYKAYRAVVRERVVALGATRVVAIGVPTDGPRFGIPFGF